MEELAENVTAVMGSNASWEGWEVALGERSLSELVTRLKAAEKWHNEVCACGEFPHSDWTITRAEAAAFFAEYDRRAAALEAAEQRVRDAERMQAAHWADTEKAVARVTQLEAALEQIESGLTPCSECGEVHKFKKRKSPVYGSWAAKDGHAYYRTEPAAVARAALAGDTETPT